VPDAAAVLKLGMRRFLKPGAAPHTHRVLFVDAPVLMGSHRWRQMDQS
jgi:hypothetical protein